MIATMNGTAYPRISASTVKYAVFFHAVQKLGSWTIRS
jgi:hypothetical protein